jgi:glycosyltransferase involved in cell wall biosynthesis
MTDGLSRDTGGPACNQTQQLGIYLKSTAVKKIDAKSLDRRHAKPHILCIGGEDHNLRIPFLLALRARGFAVTAAGTGNSIPFVQNGIDFHLFRFDRFINPLADRSAIRALARLIADVKPDIAQSFDTKPNLMVPIAARHFPNVRAVRTINGLGQIYSSRSAATITLRQVFPTLHRIAARFTTMTIFQNRDDQAFFEKHRMIGQGSSRHIPGSGVDIEAFDRAVLSTPSSAEIRQQLNLGQSEVVITVSRITRQKGIPTLLAAAALVNKERPDVRFLLVGPRESEGSSAVLQADIDRHAPYVIPIGKRSDIPALLKLADVFAFPTEYREGVPRVLLEAALANLPIVTTTMPGCTDVVRDRWSGLLVPPRDPHLLAARIVEMLRERETAHAMAARAGRLVRNEFGLELTADRYAEAYVSAIDRAPMYGDNTGTESRTSFQQVGP